MDNDFFITGESYAGVYIPTLSKEILDNAPELNLVGIAVGDPCTDNEAQRDSMDALWYCTLGSDPKPTMTCMHALHVY